jgi:hypothetical protein
MYMEVQIEAYMALRHSESYLTDESEVKAFTPSSVRDNGYRRYTVSNGDNSKFLRASISAESAKGAGYAFMQAGAFYGEDPSVSGSWLGLSSYLLTKGNISTRTSGFLLPTAPGQRRENATSVEVCISDLASGSCGAARSFLEGEFKFSLLASTLGSSFSPGEEVTHFGIRTKLDLVGADTTSLILNDEETLESIGSSDVTKLVLREPGSGGRELTMHFPGTYNVGQSDPDGFMTPSETKAVQVKVSTVRGGDESTTESIYVDYLFEMPSVGGKYIIYDPTVVDSTGSGIPGYMAYLAFDPVRIALALCALVYFIGSYFFFCTSYSTQSKVLGDSPN